MMTKSKAYLLDCNVLIALAHEFWLDDASYLDMPTTGIIGHRQVTDV